MNEGHPADGNEGLFSSLFKKITGKVKKDDDVTEEEIMDMVNEGHEQGVLKENEAEMIGNIFEFGEKHASDVMTHRKSIVGIEADTTVEEAFEFIMGENYSRYPVYDGDIDNIIGILHIRDLLKIYSEEKNRKKKLVDMKHQVLFDASYIPETRNISVLFKEMQSDKVHMAVVVDEYGQTAGIVTMEDILEAGGDDFSFEDGCVEITTDPKEVENVANALRDMGYTVVSAEAEQVPSTYTTLTDEDQIKKMGLLLETLEDNDDVQNVWHNWDMD